MLMQDCVRALEYAATLLIENGNVEGARHCLGRAVTVEPDSGHRKYFSLAQIMSGKEALQLYHKASSNLDYNWTEFDTFTTQSVLVLAPGITCCFGAKLDFLQLLSLGFVLKE